ncbi:hypothetical protein D9M71_724290 [compost metagenome]
MYQLSLDGLAFAPNAATRLQRVTGIELAAVAARGQCDIASLQSIGQLVTVGVG